MLVRAAIATTAGPVSIERIGPVRLRKSKVFTWGALSPQVAMSETYDDFVRKRISRIPPFKRDSALRMDLSRDIDWGESWQLPVFLAHALHGAGRLVGRDEDGADIFLYATGVLDFEMSAREIGWVEDKLRLLAQDETLRRAAAEGRVILALPEANAADARPEQDALRALGARIVAVRDVPSFLDRLDFRIRPRGPDEADAWEGSPFRGLSVFDVQHSKIFWGRGKAREEAMRILRQQELQGCAFLLIYGSSGVGKSSLARAGLLADLEHAGSANDRWRVITVVPQSGAASPLTILADALVNAVPETKLNGAELASLILKDPAQAAEEIAAGLAIAGADGHVRVALLVDQLETLLLWAREARSPDGSAVHEAGLLRDAFAEMLSRLARTRLIWVIATLRSDLMALLEDSPPLSALARSERMYRLERPSAGALSEIIRGPAEMAGIRFTGADENDQPFADVLIDAAKNQQDCLPLLQFTLQLLHDKYKGRNAKITEITYKQYKDLGGIEDAIGLWADKVVGAQGLDIERDRAIDDLIFNLARRGRDVGVVVGAELVLDGRQLTPSLSAVIDALTAARLIVAYTDEKTGQRTIRVAHEALLTNWPRAKMMIESHRDKLALKDDIERAALRWSQQGRDVNFLILAAVPVLEAEQLLSDHRVMLSAAAYDYVAESVSAFRDRIDELKRRAALDEQKAKDFIGVGDYAAAGAELERISSDLANETEPSLRDAWRRIEQQSRRVTRLAVYDGYARQVFPKAGEEDFEAARLACEGAMLALDVVSAEAWWESLPVEDLSGEQIADLKQDIYRLLLLHSALQLVPGLTDLFAGRSTMPPLRIPSWLPGLLVRFVPRGAFVALLRRGGFGPIRLPVRQDSEEARAAFDRSRAALSAIRRMEEASDGRRSQTSALVARLVSIFSELADGPKGEKIDFSMLLAPRTVQFAEPVNAADYFFIALTNYFVAKRAAGGGTAAVLFLLQGSFPELDPATPLATAERLLRNAVALEPGNFWTHWLLGRVLLEADDPSAAELAFNASVALEPRYARGYEQRALCLVKQWRRRREDRLRERALNDSRLAGRFAAGDPSIFWPRGELFDEMGRTAEAFDSWCFWLELEQDILSRVARGEGVARLLFRTSATIEDGAMQPLHAAARALRALVHWTQGDNPAALADAEAALRLQGRHQHALVAKGTVLLKLRQPADALREGFDTALAVNPRNFRALLGRAEALAMLDRPDDARGAWRTLLARADEDADDQCPGWIRVIAQDRA